MKFKYLLIFSVLVSCSTNNNISGSYYCTCYNDFYPRYVLKIERNNFELYSANVAGSKYIGKSKRISDVLYLYRTYDIDNNFKDTLISLDTAKFVIKGRKLIPFKNEICYLRKTCNKDKLFQMPYLEIDTTRMNR